MKGEPKMAKKVKTPEEVKAAIEKRTAKRTLFFGTFRKALAFFLAIAFTFALVQIAFTAKNGVAVATGTGTGTGNGSESVSTNTGDDGLVDLGGSDTDGNGGATDTPDANTSSEDGNSGESTSDSKAEAIKLLNEATAKAASAAYNWSRKCYYTRKIDVTGREALNKVIGMVDKSASVGTVVGGFLDVTGEKDDPPKTAKKAKGNAAPEDMKDKFLLKAMTLTEGDVAHFEKQGDVYKFQLNSCNNPKKDGNNAIHHATNDFNTEEEVAQSISEALGSLSNLIELKGLNVKYTKIVIVAEIKDGKLVSLSLSYDFDVTDLKLKALKTVNVEGNGAARVEETYNNFVY